MYIHAHTHAHIYREKERWREEVGRRINLEVDTKTEKKGGRLGECECVCK